MDGPVDVIIARRCRGQASTGGRHSGGICRRYPNDAWVSRVLIDWLMGSREFYEQLESTIKKIPRKDLLIIQGNWNAKVGPDAYKQWPGTVGRFSLIRKKFALTSALWPVDEFAKNDNKNNKSIRNDNNLPGYFAPSWSPPYWANGMKLGEFREVPEVIKRAKRHLDWTLCSGFTRRSCLPIPMHWLFVPCTAALLCCSWWMSELDVDLWSGEANQCLWKQMLQKNAWHIIQRA